MDLFGRLRRSLQAQGALVQVSQEDLRYVQVSLAAELARAYFDLRGTQEQLQVTRENAENQRRSLQVTQERLDAGRGTAFDTERAKAQLSFTLASLPGLEAGVAAAQYRIGVLVGRPPALVTRELIAIEPLPSPSRRRNSCQCRFADSSSPRRGRSRAVVRGATLPRSCGEGRLLAASHAGSGRRLFGDDLRLIGRQRHLPLCRRPGHFVACPQSWPGKGPGSMHPRPAPLRPKRSTPRRCCWRKKKVENALAGYHAARERVVRIDEAAAASRHAAELSRLRFSEGVADFLQVLDAERTQLDAESQLAQSKKDAATAYAALFKALGGTLPF